MNILRSLERSIQVAPAAAALALATAPGCATGNEGKVRAGVREQLAERAFESCETLLFYLDDNLDSARIVQDSHSPIAFKSEEGDPLCSNRYGELRSTLQKGPLEISECIEVVKEIGPNSTISNQIALWKANSNFDFMRLEIAARLAKCSRDDSQ